MSRLTFLFPLLLLAYQAGWGQTQITALSNGTIYQRNSFSLDQWQWQVSSDQYTGQPAFIQVSIFDHLGQLIYRISGNPFPIGGQSIISGTTLNIAETQYAAPAYQRSLDRLHCLPKGKYLIESTLFLVAAPDNQAIAQHRQTWYQRQSCTLPILLVSPAPNASLCETFPVFQWTVSDPAAGLQYEFSLYEQSPEHGEEIRSSIDRPVIRTVLATPVFQLGPGSPPLKKGQQYSWQILTREAGNIIARSPLRSFIYGCAGKEPKTKDRESVSRLVYLKAGRQGHPPTYTLQEPVLNFSFIQRIPQDKYQLEITDEQGNTLALQDISTRSGHNYLSFPFSDLGLSSLENGRQLMVNLRSDRGDEAAFSVLINIP